MALLSSSPRRPAYLLGVGLVLGGLSIRMTGLSASSFWLDELITVSFTGPDRSLADVVWIGSPNDANPPLYFMLLHLWRRAFGSSESAVRSLGVLLGVLTVAVSYWLGKRTLPKAAILPYLALLSCSLGGAYYAREARPYALVLLFGAAISLLYYRAARQLDSGDRVGHRELGGIAGLTVLAGYTHYLAFAYGGVVFLLLLLGSLRDRKQSVRVASYAVAAVLSLAPWLWFDLPRKAALVGASGWTPNDATWKIGQVRQWAYLLLGQGWHVPLVAVVFLVIGTARALVDLRHARHHRVRFTSPTMVFMPALLMWLGLFLVSAIQPAVVARYVLIALPSVYLAMVMAVQEDRLLSSRPSVGELVLYAVALLMLPSVVGLTKSHKEDWRGAARYIEESTTCSEASVVIWVDGVEGEFGDELRYYLRPDGDPKLVDIRRYAPDPHDQSSECPVIAWVRPPLNVSPEEHASAAIERLGLAGRDVRVLEFNGVYLLARASALGSAPPKQGHESGRT